MDGLRTPPGLRAELAAAIRRVNAEYSRLPESLRPELDPTAWARLERALDNHCRSGDREAALEAIEIWRAHVLRALNGERVA